jgi:hypothetical protein
MDFEPDDARQALHQGAPVCADWSGFGSIHEDAWFGAADVPPDAKLRGMIHFIFACHGGGCPQFDNFDRFNKSPRIIADKPLLSALPQRLLAHPNGGALACLAHVTRAWALSFQSARGGSQSQGFRDVIGRLLRGVGSGWQQTRSTYGGPRSRQTWRNCKTRCGSVSMCG